MRFMRWLAAALWLAPQVCSGQVDTPEAHLALAGVYQQKNDSENALREVREALKLQPDLLRAHRTLGEILLAQGFASEALPHLERAGDLFSQARALMSLNRIPEAASKLLAVSSQRPDDPEVLLALGETSAKIMQQSFTQLIRHHPDSPQALEVRARNDLAQGHADTAEPLLRNALELDPKLAGVHMELGRILQEQRGDLDGAEREYRAEMELRPGSSEAVWRLGSLLLKRGQAHDALPLLQQSDKLKPDMLDVLLDLGKAYLVENQVADAEKSFQRILAINDSGELASAAHLQLSQIYRKLGKNEEAERQTQRFRELTKSPN